MQSGRVHERKTDQGQGQDGTGWGIDMVHGTHSADGTPRKMNKEINKVDTDKKKKCTQSGWTLQTRCQVAKSISPNCLSLIARWTGPWNPISKRLEFFLLD